MPATWLPLTASRNLVKSCHVAFLRVSSSEVVVVVVTTETSWSGGKSLAGEEGRERKRSRNIKEEKRVRP